jgi:U3 small nucleolar RNA-associated protein 18
MSSNHKRGQNHRSNQSNPFDNTGPQKRKFHPNSSLDQRLSQHQANSTNDQSFNKKSRNNNNNKHRQQQDDSDQPQKNEIQSAWADSDDDDGNNNNNDTKNNNTKSQQYSIDVKSQNKFRKLRKDVNQTSMSQKEFIDAQREQYERIFQTPDWAKIDTKEDQKVNMTKKAWDNDDSDDDNNDDETKSKVRQRRQDGGNDDSSDDDDDDTEVKKEEEATSKKNTKSLLKSLNGDDDIVEETNDDENNQNHKKQTRIYELQHEDEEFIRNAQDMDQERTLEQLEQLFANSRNLKDGKTKSRHGTLTSNTLPPTKLNIGRLPDANSAQPSSHLLSSCGFHSNNQLLYAAGMDKTLRLYQFDGVNNPCIQSLVFDLMPIYKAGFINNESEIFISGRRKFFQVVNLLTSQVSKIPELKGRTEKAWEYWLPSNDSTKIALIGDNSTIVIISAITKQFICEVKCKGGLNDLTWSTDDQYIFTTGHDGLIYCFNIAQRQQMFTYRDQGVAKGSAISMSRNGKWLASGSINGVVNVYDTDFQELLSQSTNDYTQDSFASYYSSYTSYEENVKLPLSEVKSLLNKVEHIKFSPSNEIMAIASRNTKDAVRLIHLPTFTPFTNWPTQQTPFSYVQDIAFSADNSRVAFANDKGRVLLYKVPHYKQNCNKVDE